MNSTTANHLRHRAEHFDFGFLVCRYAIGAWIEYRVGPEIVAVHVSKLIAAKAFALAPWPALQRDHP